MHCHIAWHVSDGLAVQFLESKASIPLGDAAWDETCAQWNSYSPSMMYPKTDSGVKRRRARPGMGMGGFQMAS